MKIQDKVYPLEKSMLKLIPVYFSHLTILEKKNIAELYTDFSFSKSKNHSSSNYLNSDLYKPNSEIIRTSLLLELNK